MTPQVLDSLKWIHSNSSPILLLPRALAKDWQGQDDIGYELARHGTEPAFPISVGKGAGLVLEDGFHTTWWPLPELTGARGRQTGGLLIRWLWAKDTESVFDAVRNIPLASYEEEPFSIETMDGTLMLFEARQPALGVESAIPIFLVGGSYAVMSANVQPDSETCLLVHRLQLIH